MRDARVCCNLMSPIRIGVVRDVKPERFVLFDESEVDPSTGSVVPIGRPMSEEELRTFLRDWALPCADVDRLVAEARTRRV
jgi:hypothetical protein